MILLKQHIDIQRAARLRLFKIILTASALLAISVSSHAAEVLDDSQSPKKQFNVRFEWEKKENLSSLSKEEYFLLKAHSPPNFELKGKPGDILREVITIENADTSPGIYQVRTADWEIDKQGGVVIHPAEKPLTASSCRPWTRIERKTFKLLPKRIKRYRFEVHVPADAQDGECRFAVLISPAPETIDAMKFGSFNVPVAGAIAVVVYVTVGKAKPELEFKGVFKKTNDGKTALSVRLHNWGNAHARPSGSVVAKDVGGRKAELLLSPFPILPAETRDIRLFADKEISGIENIEELAFPLYLKGLIEWDGGTYKVDTILE